MTVNKYNPEIGRNAPTWRWAILLKTIWHKTFNESLVVDALAVLAAQKNEVPLVTVELESWEDGNRYNAFVQGTLGSRWDKPEIRARWAVNAVTDMPMRAYCFDLPPQDGDQWIPGEKDWREQALLKWIERELYQPENGDKLLPRRSLTQRADTVGQDTLIWAPSDMVSRPGMMRQWQEQRDADRLQEQKGLVRKVWNDWMAMQYADPNAVHSDHGRNKVRVLNNPFSQFGPPWK